MRQRTSKTKAKNIMDTFIQKLKSAASAVGSFFSNPASAIKAAAIRAHDFLGTSGVIAAAIATAAFVFSAVVDPVGTTLAIGAIIFTVNLHRLADLTIGQGLLLFMQSCAMAVLITYMPLVAAGLATYVCVSYYSMDIEPSQAWGDFWNLQVIRNDEYPISQGCWCFLLGWWNTTIDLIFHPLAVKALNDDGYSLRSNGLFQRQGFVFTVI